MGKKDKGKKKGKGAEKTAMKTDKKLLLKQKKFLAEIGEDNIEDIIKQHEQKDSKLVTVTETLSGPPTPRSNFSLCSHPEKDELILFGGEFFNGQKLTVYNDLYFYNILKNEWKVVKAPSGPAPRSSHQMVPVAAGGGQLWLFGGEHASQSQLQFFHFKDFWVYRINDKKWEKIDAPNGPSPRSGHRMVYMKKKLYVFGGFYDNNIAYKYYNDLFCFSLETYKWQEIKPSGVSVPQPRSACCMAASNDGKIFIWGGYCKSKLKKGVDRGVTYADMFSLVPDKNDSSGTNFKWVSVQAGGMKPQPKSSISMTVALNNKAYCFGGVLDIEEDEENLKGKFCNDLHALDLSSNTWSLQKLKTKKEKNETTGTDKESSEMNCEAIPDSKVSTDGVFTITVGGSSSSTKLIENSKSPRIARDSPSPRMNCGMAICKGVLYMYGGLFEEGNKQYTLSDFYSLDIKKMDQWKTLIANNLNAHEWIDSSDDDSDDDDDEDDDTESDEDDTDDDSDEMDTD